MRRLFGTKKPVAPTPSLAEVSSNLGQRGESLQSKIAALDKQILELKQVMAKQKPGAAQNATKARALRLLKQKKMYEKQMDSTLNQQFNVDQAAFTQGKFIKKILR